MEHGSNDNVKNSQLRWYSGAILTTLLCGSSCGAEATQEIAPIVTLVADCASNPTAQTAGGLNVGTLKRVEVWSGNHSTVIEARLGQYAVSGSPRRVYAPGEVIYSFEDAQVRAGALEADGYNAYSSPRSAITLVCNSLIKPVEAFQEIILQPGSQTPQPYNSSTHD